MNVNSLPYLLSRYFDLDDECVLVKLPALVPSKPPEGQPQSVDNAEDLMRRAALGEIDRRGPITVVRRDELYYEIIDGNATYGVARRHGWPCLPVSIVEPRS